MLAPEAIRGGVISAEIDAINGAPVILASTIQPPLEIRGPFRADDTWSFVLRNVTAGIFPGDRLDIALTARNGVACSVRATSATKVHGGVQPNPATTSLKLAAEPGATLAYAEAPLILQSGASLSQSVELVAAGGTLCYSEITVLGRLERGECAEFMRYENHLRIVSPEGTLLYGQRYALTPAHERDTLLASTPPVFGKLIVVGPASDDIVDVWSELCRAATNVYAGCDALPNEAGFVLCAAGPTLEPVEALLSEAVERVR